MPGAYPRTTSREFKQSTANTVMKHEMKLERIASTIEQKGYYCCKTRESAEGLARELNKQSMHWIQYSFIKSWQKVGFYEATNGQDPKVIFVKYESLEKETDSSGRLVIHHGPISSNEFSQEPMDVKARLGSRSASFSTAGELEQANRYLIGENQELFGRVGRIGAGHEEPEVETKFGKVNLATIDRFAFARKYDPETDQAEEIDKSYQNRALIERMNPRNNLPNFQVFSQRADMRRLGKARQAERYLEFTHNHARKLRTEDETGFSFNVSEFSRDPVKPLDMFGQPDFIETMQRASREIPVNREFLNSVIFIDPTFTEVDDGTARGLKGRITDFHLAYDNEEKAILIRNDTSPSLIANGGFFHEVFHAQLEENFHSGFERLNREFGIRPQSMKDTIVGSFEEVAAHARAFDFIGRNPVYRQQIIHKYGLNVDDDESLMIEVGGLLEHPEDKNSWVKLAEATIAIRMVDRQMAERIDREIERFSFYPSVKAVQELSQRLSRVGRGDESFISHISSTLDRFKDEGE